MPSHDLQNGSDDDVAAGALLREAVRRAEKGDWSSDSGRPLILDGAERACRALDLERLDQEGLDAVVTLRNLIGYMHRQPGDSRIRSRLLECLKRLLAAEDPG
jgi:hypothetical protein